MSVKVGIVKITPTRARRLLDEHNTNNRDVAEDRISQYAADIRNGDWEINGETIKLADDGTLLDGQHRLWGCVEAGKPFTTILVSGLSHASQDSMDQGRPRGFHDQLKLRGEPDPNVIARAIRVLTVYERTGIPYLGGRAGRAPSNAECFRTLHRNPEIRDACKFANRCLKRRFLPVSLAGVMHFLLSSVDEAASETFFTTLTSDSPLAADHPIGALRQVLLADYEDRERRLHIRTKTAYIVIAWNAWRAQKPIDELHWTTDEEFPPIHGLISARAAAA